MLELVFCLLLGLVALAVLYRLRGSRDGRGLCLGLGVLALAGVVLAVLGLLTQSDSRMFGSKFTLIGLVALGLFVHGPLFLLGAWLLLRREARGWALASAALAAALILVGIDAWFVEPTWLEVTHHRVVSAKVERPLRIVVLADLQTDALGEYERRALRTVLEQEPDLIVLTGDYLQIARPERYAAEVERLNALLHAEGFGAPLGMIAVEGNVDRPAWPAIFTGIDGQALVETRTLQHQGLWLTGLSFTDSFDTSLHVAPRDGFHVVVGHAPDFALGDVQADLLLAGHTHGGQIRIPGFGPPLTLSAVPRAWAVGRTDLATDRTLFVSRGVGMERGHAPRVRFFCRPEIVVIDVVPAATQPVVRSGE